MGCAGPLAARFPQPDFGPASVGEGTDSSRIGDLWHDARQAYSIGLRYNEGFPMPDSGANVGRVFLCHSSTDKAVVRELYSRLRDNGAHPWFDEEDLIPGQDWRHVIEQAVRLSEVIVVLMTNASVTRAGFVNREIRFALDVADEQPEGSICVIPARLEECEIPARLRDRHWVNLYETGGFEKLLKALRSKGLLRSPQLPLSPAPIAAANDSRTIETEVSNSSLARVNSVEGVSETNISVANPIKSALIVLRQTKYLWLELVELPVSRDMFATEIKETTFDNVKSALDDLANAGHLRYSVESAYNITKDSRGLRIRVSHLTTQLKNLAMQVEADGPPREYDLHDDRSDPEPYGDS